MLDEFRKLPPIARVLVILFGVAIVLAIVFVLVFAVTGQGKTKSTPSGLQNGSPRPTASATTQGVDPSTIPLPTAPPVTEVPTPVTDGTVNKTISDAEKTKAFLRVQKGVEQWCTYTKSESKANHLKRIQPYFTANNPASNGEQYIDIIQDQQCAFYQGEPQKILSKTSMTILIYATTVTIYDGDVNGDTTGDDGKQQSVGRNTQIYVTADKINGKWQISKLDFN